MLTFLYLIGALSVLVWMLKRYNEHSENVNPTLGTIAFALLFALFVDSVADMAMNGLSTKTHFCLITTVFLLQTGFGALEIRYPDLGFLRITGNPSGVAKSGWMVIIPGIMTVDKQTTERITIQIPSTSLYTMNEFQIDFTNIVIICEMTNPYLAARAGDALKNIEQIGRSEGRTGIGKQTFKDINKDQQSLQDAIRQKIDSIMKPVGWEVVTVELEQLDDTVRSKAAADKLAGNVQAQVVKNVAKGISEGVDGKFSNALAIAFQPVLENMIKKHKGKVIKDA